MADAPKIDQFLSGEASDFFGKVTEGLDAAGVAWTRNEALVRGLDYYRHTAFEFVTDRLGAQGTVLAGGRYDGLMESLGGSETPAVGWAAGIERLAMLIEPNSNQRVEIVGVMPESFEATEIAQEVAFFLRATGVYVDQLYSGRPQKNLRKLRDRGITTAIYVACPASSTYRATLNIKRFVGFSHSTETRFLRRLAQRYALDVEPVVDGFKSDIGIR